MRTNHGEKSETLKTQGESGERQSKVIEACEWLSRLRSTLFIQTQAKHLFSTRSIPSKRTRAPVLHARTENEKRLLPRNTKVIHFLTFGRVEKARREREREKDHRDLL